MAAPPIVARREGGRLDMLKALGLGVSRADYVREPMPAFLVEHPGAGPLLIDTGFHTAVAVDPKQGMGRLGGLIFKDLEMDAGQAVIAQLRDRDIDPADVGTVVMTHLHADHASGIAEFPAATFIVSQAEWDAASEGGERDGYLRRQFDHAFDYRTLDFESSDADSFATFGRSFDLFGDGSVRICFTPGHSAGHCSVVLRLQRPRGAAHRRCRLHHGHDPRVVDPAADGRRAPLPAVAARDPAVHRADARRAGDPRSRHGDLEDAPELLLVARPQGPVKPSA